MTIVNGEVEVMILSVLTSALQGNSSSSRPDLFDHGGNFPNTH